MNRLILPDLLFQQMVLLVGLMNNADLFHFVDSMAGLADKIDSDLIHCRVGSNGFLWFMG
jgi:hypothetical protein